MPWQTPTLKALRALNRDNVTAALRSGPMVPNSVMRVMSDSNAGLAYLTMLYIDWLSKQLLPDTAEFDWLVRFANIWGVPITNATYATAKIFVGGIAGTVVPQGTLISAGLATPLNGVSTINFQTTSPVTIGATPTTVPATALTPGQTHLEIGAALNLLTGVAGLNGAVSISSITDGIDGDNEDQIRANVLRRIQEPPMGGDAEDYIAWVMTQPGVTRAWCSPNEMGVGTVTVRFMMDKLRASTGGFPNAQDLAIVEANLNTKRPVAVKDFFVEAPLPEPINLTLSKIVTFNASALANINTSLSAMLLARGAPAHALGGVRQPPQTIYAAWVNDAVFQAIGVDSFDLTMSDHVMPFNGSLAVLGTVTLA